MGKNFEGVDLRFAPSMYLRLLSLYGRWLVIIYAKTADRYSKAEVDEDSRKEEVTDLDLKDCRIEKFHCGGKGGQNVNNKLLLDLGPSEATMENARRLGIPIGDIDTVVLIHGHYDHSGGILPFTKENARADIYMQESAIGDYYADDGEYAVDNRYR